MKRKAVSVVLCVIMIMSAMTFSVSAEGGEAKTLLKDDFTSYGFNLSESPWKNLPGNPQTNGNDIVNKAGITLVDAKTYAQRKLDTPIDMDSENVYYASWVQSLNVIAEDASKTFKTGFANANTAGNEDNSARTILLWQGQADNDFPTVKLSLQKNFSTDISIIIEDGKTKDITENKINVGILYNVLMRIEAHATDNDKIQVKYWQVDSAEPLNWNGEYEEAATGVREYFEVLPGGIKAYFGNLNVEVYSGDKAESADKLAEDVKTYVKSTDASAAAPDIEENSDVINGGVVYNSAKNMLKLKNNIYLRCVALLDKTNSYKRMIKTPLAGNDAVVKPVFANDTAALITGKRYLTAFVVYDADNAIEQIATYVLNSNEVSAGGSNGKGLTIDNISASAASYRIFVWDADTLAPIINDITLKNNMIINY